MKSNSLTVTSSRSWEHVATVKNPFTWENAAKFYARALPFFFVHDRATVQDAQFLTGSIAFGIFFGCVIFFVFPLLLAIFG